jgi:histidyl-tRNA synthetase
MKAHSKETLCQHVQHFADLTKQFVEDGNMKGAKICLAKADENFSNGSIEIKNLIANVYIYSVSTFLEMHHRRKQIFAQKSVE